MARIGVAGAGLLGRLLAWRLAHWGHHVSVYDPAASAQPLFRGEGGTEASGASEAGPLQAAGFTAAGMLSPLAELDNAEPAVAALGWRSLPLWQAISARLPVVNALGVVGQPWFAARGSLLLAHRPDLGAAQRVLTRLDTACATPAWQAARPPGGAQRLSLDELAALEPAVHGPAHAWLLPGEGQIDTVATLLALHADAPKVAWHWGQTVTEVQASGHLQLASGARLGFDVVIDVRGIGAQPHWPVRGVRGEVIWLHAPGHGLQRPLRLLHPRHRVYIVPRPGDKVLIGASEIESEDRSPVSLKSAVELMAAAHSVVPALAEARILRLDANLRPALPDNDPRTHWDGSACLRINGLFRHGWLLAPALVDAALRGSAIAPSGLMEAHAPSVPPALEECSP